MHWHISRRRRALCLVRALHSLVIPESTRFRRRASMVDTSGAKPRLPRIDRAAVLGSGVMGATIAAHLANAGIRVLLLDVVPKEGVDRNRLAAGAFAAL